MLAKTFLFSLLLASSSFVLGVEASSYDIVVYGGTSGGVTAGIQAARMGKTVVIIEPTKFLGGLTTGGLGATDIGNKAAIGGISREFYQRIFKHYSDPAQWKTQTREAYFAKAPSKKRSEYKRDVVKLGMDSKYVIESIEFHEKLIDWIEE